MALKRKNIVQKTFRFEQVLEGDLYLLAELTGRTQNDLVGNAIERFILENKEWFLNNAIVEHYAPIFEHTGAEYDIVFKMDGLKVELIEKDGFYNVHHIGERDGINEEFTKSISVTVGDVEIELKILLRYLAQAYLKSDGKDAQEYLKKRLDYRDYK
jgi:hypothetical protein